MKLGFRCTKRLADLIEEFVVDGDVEADEWMYSDISIAVRRMLEIFATAEILLDKSEHEDSVVIRIGPLDDSWKQEIAHQEVMGNKVVNIEEHKGHED